MEKQIFIVNGMARSGKDTFASFLSEYVLVFKYSSIDKVKRIAEECGWCGGKTEKDRKFLSDLKMLTTEYSDMAFVDVTEKIERFLTDGIKNSIMLIDIREPEEIEKVKRFCNASTIFINNPNVPNITSNYGDANVHNYRYDYVLDNDGTLEEFKEVVRCFTETIIKKGEN